jgi:TPR repeat protein
MVGPGTKDGGDGGRAPAFVNIALRPTWDASLTYDLLDQPSSDDGPVFVGRDELLGPLVNAIGQPDRRGTYLVSGYRGVGKTSLIIQAARLAQPRLEANRWTLLPIVLNVSEVSASLEPASDLESSPLQIDARRLLTAVLRALRNRVPARHHDGSPNPLAEKIQWAYRKAEATRYTETQQQRAEAVNTAVRESRRSLQVPNLFKLVAAVALLGAAAVEGIALFGSVVNQWHVIAAALAAVAVVSIRQSVVLTRSDTQAASALSELVVDNSLHQLESELKDILDSLYKAKRRTIIVLEELDKVADEEGHQLDAVIRYFKNLFTQAPALFFFLTDKAYYDLIARKIEASRRSRSYAVEHTFFTHRLFVRRPGIQECLQYLTAVLSSAADASQIEVVAKSQANRVRGAEAMSPVEQFVRALLFRSQDHFFDLKNEMRQYVRVTATDSWLESDETSMPRSERALAAFQFLVERKMLSYYFGGGRDYANEVLQSCLYAAFEALGSTEPQVVASFYPKVGPAGDQLPLGERRRVIEAVESLVEDLERGAAIERITPQPPEGASFVWRDDAAVLFQPAARLEPHEQALLSDLTRIEGIARLFAPGGRLAGAAGDAEAARALSVRFLEQVQAMKGSPAAIPIEQAASNQREAGREIAPLLERAFMAHQRRLADVYGLDLKPLAKTTPPDSFTVSTGDLQARRQVHLLYETVGQGGKEARVGQRTDELERLAVVNVDFDVPLPDPDQMPPTTAPVTAVAGQLGDRSMTVTVPLHEQLEGPERDRMWGQRTADELRFGQLWCQRDLPIEADGQVPHLPAEPYVLVTGDGAHTYPSLEHAVSEWLKSPDRVLAWTPQSGPRPAALEQLLTFQRKEQQIVVVGFDSDATAIGFTPGHEMSEPERASLSRLIEAGRVMLGVAEEGSGLEDALRREPWSGGRALVQTEWLPAEPEHVSVLHPADVGPDPMNLVNFVRLRFPDYAQVLLRPAAEAGRADAIATLVELLAEGKAEESRQWQERLVATKNLPAMVTAAHGIEDRDPDRAAELYRAAAEAGDTESMLRLVGLLADSKPEESQQWQERLVSSGDNFAMLRSGQLYEDRDPDRAAELYRAAVEAGSTEAMQRLVVLLAQRNPEESRQWQERLVASSNTDAILGAAHRIENSDADRAVELFRVAAEAGNADAMHHLVLLLADKPEESRQWQERLVASGDAYQMLRPAQTLEDRNPDRAAELYRVAAEAGNTDAMQRLVVLLAQRNPEESREWQARLDLRPPVPGPR